ncbi:MAG: hypothetical protein K1X75_07175 [Leptospirales bacterium]|nr:hypothetical protein [Leptospirales bacterium]
MAPAEAALPTLQRLRRQGERLVPLPLLLRNFLAERAPGALELIEDADLPAGAAQRLSMQGVARCEAGGFFTHDRRAERAALVVASRKNASPSANARRELAREIYERLLASGRQARDFRLIVAGGSDFLANYLGRYEALLAISWRPERPLLEQIIASPVSARAEFNVLRLADAAVASGQLLPFDLADNLKPQQSPRPRQEHNFTAPVAEKPPATAIQAAPPPVAAGQGRSGDEEFHSWNHFRYRIVGRTRGRMQRRFFVRREDKRLALAMTASAGALPVDFTAQFFERVQAAEDSIAAHRAAIGAAEQGLCTLTTELFVDGRFRSLSVGVTPVFFRLQQGRALLVPDSPGGGEKTRTVEGRFHPGDCLLIAPGRISSSEQRELLELAEALQQAPLEFPARIAAWLDWRERGRSLLLTLSNSD